LDNSLIERIHRSAGKFNIVVAGGGASAISQLLEVPGASNTLLSAYIPYHEHELRNYLGGEPEQACSSKTARALAMVAWRRARQIEKEVPVFGVACTAALATNRDRRGDDRCYIAIQSLDSTLVTEVTFDKSGRTRAEEEELCTQMLLGIIAEVLDIKSNYLDAFRNTDVISTSKIAALKSWQSLMQGSLMQRDKTSGASSPNLVFPGAFNPMHRGHVNMLHYAEKSTGEKATLEISIFNVDKPPLDYMEMESRQAGSQEWPLIFTNAPTFIEKCRLFPGAIFIVGTDTLIRIADKKYYDGSEEKCSNALSEIKALGNRFLVFSRHTAGTFVTLADLEIPAILSQLCTSVDENEFREDVSSTELRDDP
jgi:nicotinamide mononucleotide (NMN) deamidase PncC